MEYIYLIRVRESVRLNEPVYKVGRTKQEGFERFKGYPKGSELYHYTACNDCIKTETTLLRSFREKYTPRTDLGAEYFEGDWTKMRDDIHQAVTKTCTEEVNHVASPVKETVTKPPKHTALYKKGLDLLTTKKYTPRSQGPVLHFKLTLDHEILYGTDDISEGKFVPKQEVVNQLLQKGIIEVGNIYQLGNVASRVLRAKKNITISNIDDWILLRHKQEGMLLFEYTEKEVPLSNLVRLKRYFDTTHVVNSTYLATILGDPKEDYYITHLDFMSNGLFTSNTFLGMTLKEDLCKKGNKTLIKCLLDSQVTVKTPIKEVTEAPLITLPLPNKIDDGWVLLSKEEALNPYLSFKTGFTPAQYLLPNYNKQVIFGYEEYTFSRTVRSEAPIPPFDTVINERFLVSSGCSKILDCVTGTLLEFQEPPAIISVGNSKVYFEHWLRMLVHSILVFKDGYYIALGISGIPLGDNRVTRNEYISKVIGHTIPPLSVKVIHEGESPQIGLGYKEYVKAYSSRFKDILSLYNLDKCLNSECLLYPWLL